MRNTMVFALLAAVLCGCGNPDKEKLLRGVEFARANLDAVNRKPIAALSFGSIAEQGGTVLTFLTANMPENADLPRFEMNTTTQAWTVVIKDGPGDNAFTIEGYGTDLAKPLKSETVTLHLGGVKPSP